MNSTTAPAACRVRCLGAAVLGLLAGSALAAPPTLNFTANPTSVVSGGTSTLTWSTTGATACTAYGSWTGTKAVSGTATTVPLTNNGNFALVCTGPGGDVALGRTVVVIPQPLVTLTVSPTMIPAGGSATLSWWSNNTTSCTAYGAWTGSRPLAGNAGTGTVSSTSNYALVCAGAGGSASAGVTLVTLPVPAVNLGAAPAAVTSGSGSTLQWWASDATACTASGGWTGSRQTSGSESTGALTASRSYALTCTGPGGSAAATTAVTVTPAAGATFPLRVEPGKRQLVTAAGAPFLMNGDTAWSLMVQLSRAEVDQYLDDRRARGFNTLLVNLIERGFADDPPRNYYGQGPFLTPNDFATPNEAYFAHADWVLQRAAQKGFLVLLVPAYLGYNGGNEGWYQQMVGNGTAKLRSYGRFLGQRYRNYNNILWTYGGDYTPPNKDLVRAIADGVRESQPQVLSTAHCAPESAALDCWSGEPWLTVNNFYTYGDVGAQALGEYGRTGTMPFFLIESFYENEQGISVRRLRLNAWQTMLAGATGQVFGNNPIWHFDAPNPIYPPPVGWQAAVAGPGSVSMQQLHSFFGARNWWQLVPDTGATLVTGGGGTGIERTSAARASDGSFAVIYVPQTRMVTVSMARLTGPAVRARWYDPASGAFSTVAGSPFPASGSRNFTPPAANSAGASDWVLLLESQ